MSDLATEMIKERLLVGYFQNGTRLVPSELEEQLNLGRMGIREALRELVGSGLVIQKANKGVYVAAPPTIPELEALFDARCALEGKTAATAALKIDKETLADLEAMYEEMEDQDKPAVYYFLINRKFHLTLYQAAEWPHALVCITHMLDQVLSFFLPRASEAKLAFSAFNSEHRLILDAIHAKKPNEVHDLILVNIGRGRQYMTSLK
jgi:DNA-binding GntR family transcriptional regulator